MCFLALYPLPKYGTKFRDRKYADAGGSKAPLIAF